MRPDEVEPPAASSEAPRVARNDGRSTLPAPRVAAPIAPARAVLRGKSSGTLYLIGGVLVGGAITGLVLLARDFGPFAAKPSEAPAAATDLARPSPDLAHADLAGVAPPAK